jgi:ADP-heptose:LPS heptosyltransferase
VGAAFYNKTIPPQLLVSIIDSSDKNIVLIGGPEDSENATIISAETKSPVLNLTGQLSLMESASIIADAEVVISGDTGMMHIADALKVKIIAVFGSTHPILGFTPFNRDNIASSIIQNDDLSCRPCTKQGKDFCPKGHFKCMLDLKIGDIVDKM